MYIEYYQFIVVITGMYFLGMAIGAALWHQFIKYQFNKHK